LTLDELRNGVARSREKLRSLRVEYSASGYAKDGDREPERIDFYGVVAARGVCRFSDTAHARDRDGWQRNLERNMIFFTGKTLDVFCPSQMWYETSRNNAQSDHTLKVKREMFLDTLGWWPPDDATPAPRKDDRPCFLHDLLARPGVVPPPAPPSRGPHAARERPRPADFRLLPAQQQVDGAWCHVVDDPGHDRLWIDPAVGFGVRRRERYAGDPPALVGRYELSDFRQTAGVWFPWKVRQTVHTASPRTGAPNALERHVEADVVEPELNEVSEDFFVFQPPAGTLVQDRDTGVTTQVPGGLPFLDSVIRRTADETAARNTPSPRFAGPEGWEEWVPLLAVIALVVVNVGLVGRMWRGSRQGPPAASAATAARSDEAPALQNGRPVPEGAYAVNSSSGAAPARVDEH
jgi:hypothetical protein